MGSFSWMRADRLTKVGNIYDGCPFKCLIPKEFGGGFIKDHYQDYGYLGADEKYDMYELLAFWNHEIPGLSQSLEWEGKDDGAPMPFMKEIDGFTDKNRGFGIEIGCYDRDIRKLKYPLKLVSIKNTQTYEQCEGISLGDPEQGWGRYSWEKYDEDMRKNKMMSEMHIKKELKMYVDLKTQELKAVLKTTGGLDIGDDDEGFNEIIKAYEKEKVYTCEVINNEKVFTFK